MSRDLNVVKLSYKNVTGDENSTFSQLAMHCLTRQERTKSAPPVKIKNPRRSFFGKIWLFFDKKRHNCAFFFVKMCLTMPFPRTFALLPYTLHEKNFQHRLTFFSQFWGVVVDVLEKKDFCSYEYFCWCTLSLGLRKSLHLESTYSVTWFLFPVMTFFRTL